MLPRRVLLTGSIGLGLSAPTQTRAQQDSGPDTNFEPGENADFAQSWSPEAPLFGLATPPDLPAGMAGRYGNVRFGSYDDIERYFSTATGGTFVSWFRKSIAGKDLWAGKDITAVDAEPNFKNFWETYLDTSPCTLMEFLSYMTVFINEVGGNLRSTTERFGKPPDHSGISYLFDRVEMQDRLGNVWYKQSYNKPAKKLNRTAGSLFNDELYNSTHGGKSGADRLMRSSDDIWNNDQFPQDRFATTADSKTLGYLLEADFFKFRGRGLIQTTWRTNYAKLVPFIQSYSGTNVILCNYRDAWIGKRIDDVCTISSNSDWDRLFGDTADTLVCRAIRVHASDSNYLPLALTDTALNGSGPGSLVRFGNGIGGDGYGLRVKGRMWQICSNLGS